MPARYTLSPLFGQAGRGGAAASQNASTMSGMPGDDEMNNLGGYLQQVLAFQEAAAKLAGKCFRLCVPVPAVPGLTYNQRRCVVHCVHRFQDMSNASANFLQMHEADRMDKEWLENLHEHPGK